MLWSLNGFSDLNITLCDNCSPAVILTFPWLKTLIGRYYVYFLVCENEINNGHKWKTWIRLFDVIHLFIVAKWTDLFI